MPQFHVVALAHISARKLLLVRSTGKNGFYLPGGKPEPGESEIATLLREIREELSCSIELPSIRYFTTTVAQAYGKPEGVQVAIKTYTGELVGIPRPTSEVEELRWFGRDEYLAMPSRAPAAEALLSKLVQAGLID
jgi:8-oxo-dGTP diphosphatase